MFLSSPRNNEITIVITRKIIEPNLENRHLEGFLEY